MTSSEKKRWAILGGALSLTVGATLWLAANERSQDAGLAEAVTNEPEQRQKPSLERETPAVSQPGMLRPLIENEPTNVFVGKAKSVVLTGIERQKTVSAPIAALPPQPAVAAPVAPPLPFTYTGKLIEDGAYTVFLAKQDKNLVVKMGEVLDQVWRVEDIKPPLMTFIYLPMNTKLTLQIGEAN